MTDFIQPPGPGPSPLLAMASDEELMAELEKRKAARLEKYRPALAFLHNCKNDVADYYGPTTSVPIGEDDDQMIRILDTLKELLP